MPLAPASAIDAEIARFPSTRYQGSKRKLAASIVASLQEFSYQTVLDAFGGTGAVAYAFKCAGKSVAYNDKLAFNHQIGIALIENDGVRLGARQIDRICGPRDGADYPNFIERTFRDIYFTEEENRWLDMAIARVRAMRTREARAIAWFALCQAALAKRPYNLFHRRNLYMRQADVPRGFGNKASWDRSFEEHFRRYAREANEAVIDSGGRCCALHRDAHAIGADYELVYLDPPYFNRARVGVDYRHFYHFLEGAVRYAEWPGLVDWESRHRRLRSEVDCWSDADRVEESFRELFARHRNSIVAVSYRSDGTPSLERLVSLLRQTARRVAVRCGSGYRYALSRNQSSREALIVGYN